MIELGKRDRIIRVDESLNNLIKSYKRSKQEELGIELSDTKASRIFVKEFYDKNIDDFTKVTVGNNKGKSLRDKLFNL